MTNPIKKEYVCGFLMDYKMDRFIVIDKGSTLAAAGDKGFHLRSCGVGGSISLDETQAEAMVREFTEETGHNVSQHRWQCFLVKEYETVKIYFFVAFGSTNEIIEAEKKAKDIGYPEGIVHAVDVIDIFFDPHLFTHDLPSLVHFIRSEMLKGLFMKLDPEGINSARKDKVLAL